MKEFTTEKGTKLFYRVEYDLGGYCYFSNTSTPRGYYLVVKRDPYEHGMFKNLSTPQGATKVLLSEVTRRSKKQEQIASDIVTKDYLQKLANDFNI